MKAARRRGIGLRTRITVAFVAGALAVSALVAGTTYILAERYLMRQRIDDAVQQSVANVRFAVEHLAVPPPTEETAVPVEPPTVGPDEGTLSGLVDELQDRGAAEAIVVSEGRPIPSSFGISLDSVSNDLVDAVVRGRVGYAISAEPISRIVFGSPVPGHELDVYLFYPLSDLDQTLGILRRVLVAVSLGAVLLAGLVGTRVSTRVVHPVRRASRAARRVAEGLLETRLRVEGNDELAALAHSFNEMAAALEVRIARERRFVGDVSHELRTPLTTLRASTDYLLEHRGDLTPTVLRATELLAADLQYLQRLVDDLLDLSRVEAGRVEMSWERINLADLAREVVTRRTRAGEQAVQVEVEAQLERLSTVADKQRLERVVGNLVDNALTHGEGRDVVVRVGADDGIVRLSVEDRGPGIPPEVAPRIFERFFKADPSRRRGEGRGSGLGLAIARENAHLHGGDIVVYDGRTGGTKFELRLPRREQEPDAEG